MSCFKTRVLPLLRSSIKRVSISVAVTLPVAPTAALSQRLMLPLPAPTSRHCHPEVTPVAVRFSILWESNKISSASKRFGEAACLLSKIYDVMPQIAGLLGADASRADDMSPGLEFVSHVSLELFR